MYFFTHVETKTFVPVFSQVDEEDFSKYELELFSKEMEDNNLQCSEIWDYIKKCDVLTFKIFVLYFSEELKICDIAKILKVKESTVKNRLYRTMKDIRKEFSF